MAMAVILYSALPIKGERSQVSVGSVPTTYLILFEKGNAPCLCVYVLPVPTRVSTSTIVPVVNYLP